MTDPNVLVDASTGDDAAVVRLPDGRALIMTTDFFTPIVDDAYDFGRIAAANALSDVYAMGGKPLYCLSIVGWPRGTLPIEMLGDVLRGAGEIVAAAGASIVGGHSIDDPEPKFGLMVVGEADADRLTTNARAAPGDVLVLTKAIGTGIISTAIKRGVASDSATAAAINSMTTLNDRAARAARDAGVVAATDVTGFGLLGHLKRMLESSGCAAEVQADAVPLLPDVRMLAGTGAVPGGTSRNLAAVEPTTDFGAADNIMRLILCDAQTSGGLLLCVREEKVPSLLQHLPGAAVIGRVVAGTPGSIKVG